MTRSELRQTFSNTPKVFTTLDGLSLLVDNVVGGANDGEGHGISEGTYVLNAGLIVLWVDRWNVDPDALSCNNLADALLEQVQVIRRHSICLCNDRNEIDTCTETLHDLNIERLQAMRLLVL
jgi:hypothetical protein